CRDQRLTTRNGKTAPTRRLRPQRAALRAPTRGRSQGRPSCGGHAGARRSRDRHKPENGLRPSVAYLFRSVAAVCGPSAVGVLLTGMGKDGAEELKHLKDLGAVTIAQDQEISVVHGMPG